MRVVFRGVGLRGVSWNGAFSGQVGEGRFWGRRRSGV